MAPPDIKAKSRSPAWQAQILRITVFPTMPEADLHQEWWRTLFGDAAEQVTNDKKQLLHQEKGTLDGATLLLSTQPGRIDWQYIAAQDLGEFIEAMPTLGPFSEALGRFIPIMTKWVSTDCPNINRIAFGAVLHHPVPNRQTGYEVLGNCLQSVQVDLDATDFLYQINRKKASKSSIPDFFINRLTKWSVALMQLHLVEPSGKEMRVPERFAARLDLDINTPADYKDELSKEQRANLLNELVTLGLEIAQNGEIS